MRIEGNMATLKTQEMTADRARDARVQSLNPAAMEQEEDKLRDEELRRPKSVEEAEYARVEENQRQPDDRRREGQARGEAEEAPPEPDDETLLLRQEAAEQLLHLPVDVGKFAGREQRRIDLRL